MDIDQPGFSLFNLSKTILKVDRNNGLRAINMREHDELIGVLLTDGSKNIILGTHYGYSVSFNEKEIRAMGRTATGVRGVSLRDGDFVIGLDLLEADSEVLVVTENGYGKRTPAKEYVIKGRGTKGIKTVNSTSKNGRLVGLITVNGDEDIMVMTNKGVMMRFHSQDVSQTGRATQGVRVIRLGEDSVVSTLAKVAREVLSEEESSTID